MTLPYQPRIAFISEHASPTALLGSVDAGGQNVYVDEVSRNLALRGYRVDIFTRRDCPHLPRVLDWTDGVRIIHLDAGPAEHVFKDDVWPMMPDFRDDLLRFCTQEQMGYDLLHGNFWMSGWVAAELRRRLGISAVQIFHAMGLTKRRHQGGADTSPDARIEVERQVIREVDRVIAQCPAELTELVDDYGAPPDKVTVIPSAVNVETFRQVPRDEARRRLGLEPDGLVVVYVGRMLPRKDVRNVVRVAARLLHDEPGLPLTLLLVGGETREPDPVATPEIGELQRLAFELDIAERVRFPGKRQPDELRWYYGAGDVAVTTPWYEPFGLTPLEGMACGLPVVGSDVGGISFTVSHDETGLLVPPRDPDALAAALRALLRDPDRRARMGVAARARVERGFTWPVVAARTAALYDELRAVSVQPSAVSDSAWAAT